MMQEVSYRRAAMFASRPIDRNLDAPAPDYIIDDFNQSTGKKLPYGAPWRAVNTAGQSFGRDQQDRVPEKLLGTIKGFYDGAAKLDNIIKKYSGQPVDLGKIAKGMSDIKAQSEKGDGWFGSGDPPSKAKQLRLHENLFARYAEGILDKDSPEADLFREMSFIAANIASDIEGGKPSNFDTDRYIALFTIDPRESTEHYFERLAGLSQSLKEGAIRSVELAKANKYDTSGIERLLGMQPAIGSKSQAMSLLEQQIADLGAKIAAAKGGN
jgi:hypothetical protein